MPQSKMPDFARYEKWVVPAIILILLLSSLGSIFYTIAPDERGVVQRFGRYVRSAEPGLHFKLPFGVETVKKVQVTHVFKEEFGFKTLRTGVRTSIQSDVFRRRAGFTDDPFLAESLMLTGDLNSAVVEWIVQYKISDPVKYLFQMRNL